MKVSRLYSISLILFLTICSSLKSDSQIVSASANNAEAPALSANETLLLQLYVDKGEYNSGDTIQFSGRLSSNGIGVPNAQVCPTLKDEQGMELWSCCVLTDEEGWFYENLEAGYAIPQGYIGYLLITVNGAYDGQEAYQEMRLSYGLGVGYDEDDELSLTLYPYTKYDYVQGENITVGIIVSYQGQPLVDTHICPLVTDENGMTLVNECYYTNENGEAAFMLGYNSQIPTGFIGDIKISANISYAGAYAEHEITLTYSNTETTLPLELDLWGPLVPIQIGGWEIIQMGGIVTSQGLRVDDALVSITVAGSNYQTSSGLVDSGEFFYHWDNNTFSAGEYTIQVTVSKAGYQNASGSLAFTVFGGEYDFAAVLDPIPLTLTPGLNIPFPGTLTLGGNPVSDWIEIDITLPDGSLEAFSNLSDANGHFIHTQPSLMTLGTYQMVIYYQSDRKQISPIYTFTVGEGAVTTVTPTDPPPIQKTSSCEIKEVNYPTISPVGVAVEVSGRVLCSEDGEISPQKDWEVQASPVSEALSKSAIVKTDSDGFFTAIFTPKVFLSREIIILASDPSTETRPLRWFGPFSVVVEIEPEISLSQTDYDQGEIVTGKLKLNPNNPVNEWDAGLEIFYQITGPIEAAAKQYLFESQYIFTEGLDQFIWRAPPQAGAGKYTLLVNIYGQHIANQTISVDFYVNDIRHTNLSAHLEAAQDGWSSAFLVGQFTDFEGAPIPNADLRLVFFGDREFNLSGSSDEFGQFTIDLEPLDLFTAQGQPDPWSVQPWQTVVYANKEGYATGATMLTISVPTIKPRLEIISVNPPLDELAKMAAAGLSYEQFTKMNIQVGVRYNNILGSGAKLGLTAQGNYAATYHEEGDQLIFETDLNINGEQMPTWQADKYLDWRGARTNMVAYPNFSLTNWYYYYYPKFSTHMPAQQGLAQESQFTVSGSLFGYYFNENSPNPNQVSRSDQPNPTLPPTWITNQPVVKIDVSLGSARAGVVYNIKPPTIKTSGAAWVSPTSGELQANLQAGQASGFLLPNQKVNLNILAKDINTGEEKPSNAINLSASAISDEKGNIKLPLTTQSNPCQLVEEASYYVEITSPGLEGVSKIPIEIRCIEKLDFILSESSISVVQAVDLTDQNPIQLAANKDTGVRVYLTVDGEIFPPANKPVQYEVKFELLAEENNIPLFTQTKTVSLTANGAKVNWSAKSTPINTAGIGEILSWKDKPVDGSGREVIPVDFVFTPREIAGSDTQYQIRITVDPAEVYGKKLAVTKSDITVKKMQRLQILFVPVDLNPIPMRLILEQINFLSQAYPLGIGDIGWGIAPNFPSAEMTSQYNLSGDTLSWLGQIALNIGERYTASNDPNISYQVVGVVANDTWMDAQASEDALEASGANFGNGVCLIRDWNDQVEYTLAHEIGHNLGLYRSTVWSSVSKVYLGGEGSEQYDLHPPAGIEVHGLILKNGQIFEIAKDFKDSSHTQWKQGFNSSYKNEINVVDFMGNAEGNLGGFMRMAWVIPETYTHIFGKLADPPGMPILMVQGVVKEDYSIGFSPIWQMKGLPDMVSEQGEYLLELLSSTGQALYSTRFSIHYGKPDAAPIFSLKVPFLPGTDRLVISDDSQSVGEIVRSGSLPEIHVTGQPVFSTESQIPLQWSAQDANGDLLTYSLYYQCDDSPFWQTLDADLTETSYVVDTSILPGGKNCQVRLMSSDGFNTTEAFWQPFSVGDSPPIVQIFNEEEAVYQGKDGVWLHGAALDVEDGLLPDENLHWFSDLDGDLGMGKSLLVNLSFGSHILTLYAQDSKGNTAAAKVVIHVEADAPLTGMGSGLQGLWTIGILGAVILLGLSGFIALVIWLRKRSQSAHSTNPRRGVSCLLSLLIAGGIGLLVVSGILLAAFEIIPVVQISSGTGDPAKILKMGGGGLLISLLGLLLLNSGIRTILTRQAFVEDELGRRREKRGCSAILNGLGKLFFGALCFGGGLGWLTLVFYQEVLPWLNF